MEECKQVIIVRSDLRMSRGKLAVQVAHASVSCILEIIEKGGVWREWLKEWVRSGQKKVVVKVDSKEELEDRYKRALELGIPASYIIDAGRTELEPGTPTCVGLGPAPSSIIDKVTGDLKLL